MIICICNALSDAECSQVACRPDCATVGCVCRHLGCHVRCGKCVPMMADLFRRARAGDAREAADAEPDILRRPVAAAAAG